LDEGYRRMVEGVRRSGAFDTDEDAARALEVVLGEVASSLDWGDTNNIADRMPRHLRQLMVRRSYEPSMARFSSQAFLRRVAEQEGVDERTAARHVKAVVETLRSRLPGSLAEPIYEELVPLWRTLPAVLGEEVHP
jgi:uncharacterized protein (DUF2267 family)